VAEPVADINTSYLIGLGYGVLFLMVLSLWKRLSSDKKGVGIAKKHYRNSLDFSHSLVVQLSKISDAEVNDRLKKAGESINNFESDFQKDISRLIQAETELTELLNEVRKTSRHTKLEDMANKALITSSTLKKRLALEIKNYNKRKFFGRKKLNTS
jgi:cysteinyl-tRNA synthetase